MSGRYESLSETGDAEVREILRPMLTQRRLERIESVLAGRTYNLSAVLDGLCDTGNMSAIMRTCDGLGVQRVNLVMTAARYKVGRKVSIGSHKWLDIHHYDSPSRCALELKEAGYRLLATHLDGGVPLDEIDFSARTALVFGSEGKGVCDELLQHCDGRVIIPMSGFSQSLNVSVAAAMSLYQARLDRTQRLGRSGDLTREESDTLRERFFRRSIQSSDAILSRK